MLRFLQPLINFVYGLVIGGVDLPKAILRSHKYYIQIMEQEAQEAEKR